MYEWIKLFLSTMDYHAFDFNRPLYLNVFVTSSCIKFQMNNAWGLNILVKYKVVIAGGVVKCSERVTLSKHFSKATISQ